MIATTRYANSAPHDFLPTIPSPLSPRSANIYGRQPFQFMSNPSQTSQYVPTGQENSDSDRSSKWEKYSKRSVKKAPSPKPDEVREKRRCMFLKKVREGREDKRYEQRGEDIMRLDFMRERRKWEAEQARDASQQHSEPIEEEVEEDYELPASSAGNAMQISEPAASQQPLPEEELDEVLMREQEEMDALLSFMPDMEEQPTEHRLNHMEDVPEHFWSDDDDYDALFSQVMASNPPTSAHGMDMDLS